MQSLFPNCGFNSLPEDHLNYELTQPQQIPSDVTGLANFMLFLAPPAPVNSYGNVSANSINNGRALFTSNAGGVCLVSYAFDDHSFDFIGSLK